MPSRQAQDFDQAKNRRPELPPIQFMLPDPNDFPARPLQFQVHLRVPLDVPLDFWLPKIPVGFDFFLFRSPIVAVPEVAVHENCDFPASKTDVWFARDRRRVAPVPKTEMPQRLPQRDLRAGVFRADFPHEFGAFGGGVKTLCFFELWYFYFWLLIHWVVGNTAFRFLRRVIGWLCF